MGEAPETIWMDMRKDILGARGRPFVEGGPLAAPPRTKYICDDEHQSAISAAVKAEMERCAGIAEAEAERIDADRGLSGDSAVALNIAAAIRALPTDGDG